MDTQKQDDQARSTLATGWPSSAVERNNLVGDTLGLPSVTQCWIGFQGKRMWITPHTEEERAKAQTLIDYFTHNDANWEYFLENKSGARAEMRGNLEALVERWHIRYSDTPGGGWDVIEWLRARGPVNVASVGEQWRVAFGEHAETAPTMAEAACLMALRVSSANGRDQRRQTPDNKSNL